MEQLVELLQQIQDLAGVAIDALSEAGAAEGAGGDQGAPPDGGNSGPAGPPPEGEEPPAE